MEEMVFADRHDAGRRLAAALARFKDARPLVLALPRGGVPVGFEIAQALQAPLDVLLVRKIGAPGHRELGIGAVVDGAEPQVVMNEELARMVGASPAYIEAEVQRQLHEIDRVRQLFRGTQPPMSAEGRTAIVVDDGIATGGTARAALRALKRLRPFRRILAVPVAAPDSIEALSTEADEIICLAAPRYFRAVGEWYDDFRQTSDEEVIGLLREANEGSAPGR
ncbi:MAG: phosphoribosyltransferase [Acetobacteraceae bacterium]|nr:phosphoribosyltransferase [Acetobacteraceae bacterium]MBV8522426.1 phosphoribosyltransferase [Acetobacteraceae bacterium]MBV8591161.1 phosphoribosyltransferase [Acetobacteraceae bacterium]